MKNIRLIGLLLLLLLIGSVQVYGAASVWNLDKAHSGIYFTVSHIFSKVNGYFGDFETDIRFDPKDLENSSFIFKIKVASINTAIAKRDKHLQSGDFFAASKYPFMTFSSSSIVHKGDNKYDVMGTLSIKGKKYDFTLPLTLAGIKEHPAKKGVNVAGFNSRLTLNRLDYGVGDGTFYKMGVVGKDVEVLVTIEALQDK